MNAPIADFVRAYAESGMSRLHMPGHKGESVLGCESWDITEISGADSLYEAEGIIAQSEANAAALFGARRTLYSTEGSSQCIRAMLYLAVTQRKKGASNTIVAARNVHKAFVYAAALIGFDIVWLWPDRQDSLCACPVSAKKLARALDSLAAPPAAVYVTSPDYLGGMQDVASLADVCHARGTILAVDNAHGAYLHFVDPPMHPMDLGADICCDSAHKTLPVLTGGAYLHISNSAPAAFADNAKAALALFGSTSPSYLTLCSLDMCNMRLATDFRENVAGTAEALAKARASLLHSGWNADQSEPLKLTIHASMNGINGVDLARRLRGGGVECEFADADDVVLMASPGNAPLDFQRVCIAAGKPAGKPLRRSPLPLAVCERAVSVRDAFFAPHETIAAANAQGRICAAPTVACPPAIPIVVSGELITADAVELLMYYGVNDVSVVLE